MRVFGQPSPGRQVSIERTGVSSWGPDVVTVRDARLPAGRRVTREDGRAGHRVTVWRVVREGGQVVKRERISRDVYSAFDRVVALGAGPAPEPAPGAPRTPSVPPKTPTPVPSPVAAPDASGSGGG
jgi:hypothetical protein